MDTPKDSKYRETMELNEELRISVFEATELNEHEYLIQQLDRAGFADILNENNETPLNIKSRTIENESDIRTAKILIEHGADILWPDNDDISPAKYLLFTKDPALIDLVLQELLEVNSELDPGGNTALHIAVEAGDEPTIFKLLKLNADANIKNGEEFTPIHMAMLTSGEKFLEKLVKNGGDINMPGPESLTPLHMAARLQRFESIKAVLNCHPEIDVMDSDQLTPLMTLVKYHNNLVSHILLLLDHGANPGFSKSNGFNCLHILANETKEGKEHPRLLNFLIRLFLQHGVDINALTQEQETALHFSVYNKASTMTVSLLRYGADAKLRGKNGTVLDVAFKTGNKLVNQLLSTRIALEDGDLLEYFTEHHPIRIVSIARYLLTQNQEQMEIYKNSKVTGTDLTYHSLLTMSVTALAKRMAKSLALRDFRTAQFIGVPTFTTILRTTTISNKTGDGRLCLSAYKTIQRFLEYIFSPIVGRLEDAKIVSQHVVLYFGYHEALKLQRQLCGMSTIEHDWKHLFFKKSK